MLAANLVVPGRTRASPSPSKRSAPGIGPRIRATGLGPVSRVGVDSGLSVAGVVLVVHPAHSLPIVGGVDFVNRG
jgi:hypothetical protein